MSDITPYSHHDDFHSLTSRLPRSPSPSLTSTTAPPSTYTGSYLDDGADLFPPTSGLGAIDTSFYTPRTPPHAKSVWNATIAQAVSGDIQRSLARIRGAGKVAVVGGKDGAGGLGDKESGDRDVVRIPPPRQWGTFVIKGGNGVVVVGPDGEFEAEVGQGLPFGGKRGWVRGRGTRKRQSSVGSVGKYGQLGKTKTVDAGGGWEEGGKCRERSKRDDESNDNQHSREHVRNTLTPVVESDEDDFGSPTRFFMTGGTGNLLSQTTSSIAAPTSRSALRTATPTIPHAITWDTSPVASIKTQSVPVSVPGYDAWGEEGEKGLWGGEEVDEWSDKRSKTSTKSFSTYRCPTVEDAADGTPPWEETYSTTNWEGSKAGSVRSWGQDEKPSQVDAWDNTSKKGRVEDGQSWRNSTHGSERSWDGFERVKTLSEASIAGSNLDERSWSGSQASSIHRHRPRHRHLDASSQGSHSRAASLRSGAGSKKQKHDGWGSGGEQSADGWGATSRHGSEKSWIVGGSKGGRGFYEGDENWAGTRARARVKITSRRNSAAG